MIFLALQAGDWALITVALIVVGSVIGGMIKFYQAISILRKGPPQIDPEVLAQQQQENQSPENIQAHEQKH